MECPACSYARKPTDQHIHPDICPACGIAYHKFSQPSNQQAESTPYSLVIRPYQPLWRRALSPFLSPPSLTTLPHHYDIFYGVLYVFLLIWGLYFFIGGVNAERVMGSFLHNIWLPFHEFGHVFFSPFGDTLMILGGSLFQLLLPWVFIGVFTFQQRNNLSSSVVLWWAGQSWVDIAPYIQDAPYRALPLIGGMDESAHDWGNLLTQWGMVSSANVLAYISFWIGMALMLLSLTWGFWLLRLRRSL